MNTQSLRRTIFWPIWYFLTAAAAIGAAWVVRSSRIPALLEQTGSRPAQFHWSRTTMICLAMLMLFFGAYVAMILVGDDFAINDNSQLTAFSLRGINLPIPVWPQAGRFFPFGLQEFNLIGHFTKTIAGYHVFPIMELVLLAMVLLSFDNQLSIAFRVVLIILALITPGVVVSFTGLIYPERNVLVLLVCLVLFVKLFEQTHSVHWAVAAVVSAQVMLYFKEPVFLLLLGFAAARIGFRSRNSRNAGPILERLGDKENRLDVCIAAVSIVFLGFYGLMMFPYFGTEYQAFFHLSVVDTARYYLEVDLLAWTFAMVAMVRMYRIFRGRIAPLLLWDGLACGGLVYFAAYLSLRMVRSYYLAPVDLIAVLYLGHLLYSSWGELRLGVRVLAAALAVIVICQCLVLSTFHVLERKFFIRQKAAIARLVLETYQRKPGSALNLYFPMAQPWVLSEFAAYLSYRGLPMEEQAGDDAVPAAPVRILAAKIAKDGRCVHERPFMCHAPGVEAASLVIVLPDDVGLLPEEWNLYRQYEERLHSYDPRTRPPGWLLKVLVFLWGHVAR